MPKKKYNKNEKSEMINVFLDWDIKWHKLDNKDLDKIIGRLNEPKEFLLRIARARVTDFLDGGLEKAKSKLVDVAVGLLDRFF